MWHLTHIASIKICFIEATYCIQINMMKLKMALRTEMNKLAMRTQVLARCLTQNQKGFIPFSEYLIGSLKEQAHFQNMQEQFLNKHARPKNAFYPKKVSSI
jgi:hypothetical protein